MSYLDFNKMLDNLYDQLDQTNSKTTFYIPEPKINKKPTRLDWLNATEFLKTINRSLDHFINFLKTERKVIASYHKNIIIIKGKFRKTDINKMMIEYVNKFCKCPVCSSFDTLLAKDGTIRRDKLICQKCKSTTFC